MSDEFDFNEWEEIEQPVVKIITVVGRSSSMNEFENTLKGRLDEPFKVKGVVPLEQDQEAKNFLAYIDPGSDYKKIGEEDYQAMIETLSEVGMYGVEIHDSVKIAVEYVEEQYGDRIFAPFKIPLRSGELAKRDILFGLISTGQIGMIRGILVDKPVVILAHMTEGTGEEKDTLVTPYAIMVDDDLGPQISIPFNSSFDK